MSEALPGLIILAIGGSVAPPLLFLTILFLGSQEAPTQRRRPGARLLRHLRDNRCLGDHPLRRSGERRFHGWPCHQHDGRSPARRPWPKESAWLSRSRRVAARVDGIDKLRIVAKGVRDRDGALPASDQEPRDLCRLPQPDHYVGPWPPGQHRGARARVAGLRRPGSRAHRSLRGRAATGIYHTRVFARVDGKARPCDHGRALPRFRSVLPRGRSMGRVRAWAIVRALQCSHRPEVHDGVLAGVFQKQCCEAG